MTTRPLPYIIALARAGSLARAWALFEAGGYLARPSDPAALSVKGRLLKDRALRAVEPERSVLYEQAAEAYLAADRLQPEPYRLINAASLHRLAGDAETSRVLAGDVLARLDDGGAIAETPYYIEATRAEARLLRGDIPGAAAALKCATEAAPGNWTDQAGTLKQLGLICTAAGHDTAWLDPIRPPASLHFVGHMGFAAGGGAELELALQVDSLVADEAVGFAYGALAAGADIIIAERILAAGAELHVVLPTPLAIFVRDSVDPAGPVWRGRFEALVHRARTVRCVTRYEGGHDSEATCLANEVAMGVAVLNARQLQSRAVQIAVLDENGGGLHSARLAGHWRTFGRRQVVVTCPRDGEGFEGSDAAAQPGQRRCSAVVHIALRQDVLDFDRVRRLGSLIAGLSGELAAADVSASPSAWRLRYNDPKAAAQFAFALRGSLAAYPGLSACIAMAAHYSVREVVADPASRAEVEYDLGDVDDDAVRHWCLPGTVTVSGDFLAALSVEAEMEFHAEPMGEHDDIRLFALDEGVTG